MKIKKSTSYNDNLNFGIIGNCKSSALINEDSSIDWSCLPEFDSPSVFCKILDEEIGGNFKIECDSSYSINQYYMEKTCILITCFQNSENKFEVIDFMPRYQKENGVYYSPPQIVRVLKLIKGNPKFKVIYDPRLWFLMCNTIYYI